MIPPLASRIHRRVDDLNTLVRRVDEDRWLASRFAPAHARARLVALYAVNYEIARTAEVAREPAIGAIRLQWWREALAEAPPGAHPALDALRAAWPGREAAAFDALIESRGRDLDLTPLSAAEIEPYVDGTAGALMRLAVAACGAAGADAFIKPAARAWAYVGLQRAGRAAGEEIAARAEAEYHTARVRAKEAPAAAFPAIGYVALVPDYLRALRNKRSGPALLTRQLRLVGAAATGRV